MNSRLSDRLVELPEQTLRQLRADIDALRGRQSMSAGSGLLGYTAQNDVEYDIKETISNAGVVLKLTFTGGGSQPYPFANPYLDLFVGGVGDAFRLDQVQQSVVDGPNFARLMTQFLVEDTSLLGDRLSLAWTVGFQVVGTMTYQAKGYGLGTSPGSITVERL